MRMIFLFIIGFLMTSLNAQEKIKYPQTKKIPVTDNYFGKQIEDQYRWLEDDHSEETMLWVKSQNAVTENYFSKIPFRDKIKDRIKKIYNYPKYTTPFKKGGKYYFYKNDGLQNQSVLYVQKDLKSEPEVFLDPNTLSSDGTVALSDLSFSKTGEYCAYATAVSGSDWSEIFVMNAYGKKKLDDHIKWIKFSGISWYKDGFFYSRYNEPDAGKELSSKNEYHKVFYHKMGTMQSADQLIYEEKDKPLRNCYAQVTEDERFLILYLSEGASGKNAIKVKNLEHNSEFYTVINNFENSYSVIDNLDNKLLVVTNWNAAKKQLVLIDPVNSDPQKWQQIIPEQNEVLESVDLIGGKIVAQYLKDASNHCYIYSLIGEKLVEVKLPALGTLSSFSGDKNENEAFYSFTSFTYPSVIYKYNISTNKSEVFKSPEIDFNFSGYETKEVFVVSKDGTKIPLFIVHKKGLKLDGANPSLLYGYGGFNVNMTPGFSISRLILLENGGVYAMAVLRGGGEYGEEWYKAGMLFNKQNVFDDFISCAEYLIDNKYTSASKLGIQGGSNGGTLIGAVINQRPELFRVAFPAVGVMDMLRYHKFTIGWAWVPEYGSSDDSLQFLNLYKYSPIHNIKGSLPYPSVLVTTADHDDRVVPAHSFKYISTLQEKYKGNNPVLIRIETKAGHGAGKPTTKIIEEQADIWSFFFFNIGTKISY